MKTYNKTSLPREIVYRGDTYVMNPDLSGVMATGIAAKGWNVGIKHVCVNVLSNALKGRTDLHGNAYQPTKWIFTIKN